MVHDSCGRRNNAEAVKGLLTPAQEFISLTIALEFGVRVAFEGLRVSKIINLHGVINHQVHRHQRVDLRRIAAQALHG